MINKDGELSANIPKDKVTWYNFLQFSRILNSEEGGWDSPTNWTQVLKELTPENISAWTHNSLNPGNESLPPPRERSFQIKDRHNALIKNKRGRKGAPEEGTENRLNWELSKFLYKKFPKDNPSGTCITYELPLVDKSEGQLKADVVVFDPQKGLVEIIELKRGNADGTNSPLMALVESICYALQLVRCWENLQEEIKWGDSSLKTINLILAAPEGYWGKWKGHGYCDNIHVEKFGRIVDSVSGVIDQEKSTYPKPKLNLLFAECVADGKEGLKSRDKLPPEIFSNIVVSNPVLCQP